MGLESALSIIMNTKHVFKLEIIIQIYVGSSNSWVSEGRILDWISRSNELTCELTTCFDSIKQLLISKITSSWLNNFNVVVKNISSLKLF